MPSISRRYCPARVLILLGAAALMLLTACGRHPAPMAVASLSSATVPRHDIVELTIQHNVAYKNKFFDAALQAIFVSPAGAQHTLNGFFYGGDLWKVRFRPDETGRWTYQYVISGKEGFRSTGQGQFEVTRSTAAGPVSRSSRNPYRWEYANGRPYFPLGLQDCVGLNGDTVSIGAIDGGSRGEGSERKVSLDEYLSIYGHAGFNLLRFSQMNCSSRLYDDLDDYREKESLATDELLVTARRHGFRVMFGFFGFNWDTESRYLRFIRRKLMGSAARPAFSLEDPELLRKQERFIDYCIARWGVYVDFWELLNETEASDQGTTLLADYVHAKDPDHKPVSTSWEKPYLKAIDINAPHWYTSEDELHSDVVVQRQAEKWKTAGKPVIVGEHGNMGMNWDPRSAVRMRIRAWTSLFNEIALVFWNTSWSKFGVHQGRNSPGDAANIYLGPEERGYTRTLQDFASQLDGAVNIAAVTTSSSIALRGYGLMSKSVAAAYLVNGFNHDVTVDHAAVEFPNVAATEFSGRWVDPATGRVIAEARLARGQRTLKVPPFNVDIAVILYTKGAHAAGQQ